MRVETILPVALQRLITIQADAPLVDVAKLLCDTHRALVVVCDPDGIMAGVITKTDVVRQIARSQNLDTITAAAVMGGGGASCRSNDLLHDVLTTMKERGFVHIPIVDQQSRPSGVVNAWDALQALLKEVKDDQLLLRDYVMGIGYR